MSVLSGVYRIGNDPEVKTTQNNKTYVSLSLAYNYGMKGPDGKKPSQWISATVWGKMAESLAPYLTKGSQIFVVMNDVHVDQYVNKEGKAGVNLKATVLQINLLSTKAEVEKVEKSKGFADLDSEIPF